MVSAVDDAYRFHFDFPDSGRWLVEPEEDEFGSSFFHDQTVVDRNFCALVEKFKISPAVDTDRNPRCRFAGRGSQCDR